MPDVESKFPIFQVIGGFIGMPIGAVLGGNAFGGIGAGVGFFGLLCLGAWIGKQLDLAREHRENHD